MGRGNDVGRREAATDAEQEVGLAADARAELWQQLVAMRFRLRRFAYGLTGSLDEADELLQGAYERALTRLHQFRPGTRLDSWMFRILQTMRLNALAAGKVRGAGQPPIDPDRLIGGDSEAEVEARLTLERVREQVARLPEEQRVVLLLVVVEGLSYKEVGEALEIPIGTVTSRLARARVTLRDFVQGGGDRAPPRLQNAVGET
jgi:RNA polymerase sigma-70 factor (ECF subfamily)